MEISLSLSLFTFLPIYKILTNPLYIDSEGIQINCFLNFLLPEQLVNCINSWVYISIAFNLINIGWVQGNFIISKVFFFLSFISHLKKRASEQHHLGVNPGPGICTFQFRGPHGYFLGFHFVFLPQGTNGTILFSLVHGSEMCCKSASQSLLGRRWSIEDEGKWQVLVQLLWKKEKESEVEWPTVPITVVCEAQTGGPGFGEFLRNPSGKITDCSGLCVHQSTHLTQSKVVVGGMEMNKIISRGWYQQDPLPNVNGKNVTGLSVMELDLGKSHHHPPTLPLHHVHKLRWMSQGVVKNHTFTLSLKE